MDMDALDAGKNEIPIISSINSNLDTCLVISEPSMQVLIHLQNHGKSASKSFPQEN